MRIAIVGSREPKISYERFCEIVTKYTQRNKVDKIVSGGAAGIDTFARQYAEERGIKLVEFLPDYEKDGRGAPLVRNQKIVDASDVMFAFPCGECKGTHNSIEKAKKAGRIVKIFYE